MGRRPWATPDQTAYLESCTSRLEHEKAANGLKAYYNLVASKFLDKWPAVPTVEELKDAGDELGAKNAATKRRTAQIHEWFKSFRKRDHPSQSKPLLDLTGKNSRKPAALQFHHAYSIRFHRAQDSPLRQEVEDLWKRRREQSVVDLLAPFMGTEDPTGTRFQFHNAVMRWKCSLFTDEERQEHQDWIDKNALEREEEVSQPWKATQTAADDDELALENEHIQGCIDALPNTIDKALEQIERSTGMKAFILIGGPTPAEDGDFTTHYYETGRSQATDLSFSQSWAGFATFHRDYVKWLCTAYTKEQVSRRMGRSTPLKPTTPTATPTPTTETPTPTPTTETSPPAPPPTAETSTPTRTTIAGVPATTNPAGCVSPVSLTSPSSPTPPQEPMPPRIPDEPPISPAPKPPSIDPGSDGENGSPRNLLSGSHTAELANNPDQATDEQDPPPDVSNRFARLPSPPEMFSFCGSAPFITAAVPYLHTVPAGSRWSDMVNSFLRLEELPPISGCPIRLPAQSRPGEVAKWMKNRSYDQDHLPFVSDVSSYSKNWIAWWTSCQPAWRRAKEWPLPRGDSDTNWVKTGARGQNGLFLVVLSTAWWAYSIRSEEDWAKFDEAIEDMEWVFGQVSNSLKTLQANTPIPQPAPPKNSEKPKSNVNVRWLAREEGKRQAKPSRKLVEGGGF